MKNKHTLLPLALITALPFAAQAEPKANIDAVLSQSHACSDTIVIRSQALTKQQISDACQLLQTQEANFHQLFGTLNKPVANDNNHNMRANLYHSREDYVEHVTQHFDVPSDNGGMYLEGLPWKSDNQAEFVAYEKKGQVWNLAHEYVHYLDGRFNLYGDFCLSLHDSHSGPEYCPKPAPLYPHTVWWSEGVAEYISIGSHNPKALALIGSKQTYALSDIFNTSYEKNGGTDRVYRWGYLAVRFMIENHKDKIDTMLDFTRVGDYPRYQALLTDWGTSMDAEFDAWLKQLKSATK